MDKNKELNELNKIFSKIKNKEPVKVNDIVYGEVIVVKDNLVVVDLDLTENKQKVLSPATSGVIFVKNLDKSYVEKTEDCYIKGDFIRCRIIEVGEFEYKLATNEPELGAIKAHCKKCKSEIWANGTNNKNIRCLNCGTIQSKKFANW